MGSLDVVVFTCDKYLWCLRPFAYLFDMFWPGQQVIVVGYGRPDFALPPNFSFYSIAPECYPAERWSDGVIEFLTWYSRDHFILMLEDYWLCRWVDTVGVEALAEYAAAHSDVWRIDLTGDRLYSGAARDVGFCRHLDLIETPPGTPYQVSTQACIMNRKLTLRVLQPGITPWQFELETTLPAGMRVLGTRQMPVRYILGISNAYGLNWTGIKTLPEGAAALIPGGLR